MNVSEFNYNLPEELIAQIPIKNRDESRLMVLNRQKETIEHKVFRDILDYLQYQHVYMVKKKQEQMWSFCF